ncbi:MAG: S8 family serine peptidase, partial [Gemmatimonadota bacterium]
MRRQFSSVGLLVFAVGCGGTAQRVRPNVDPVALPAPGPRPVRADSRPMLPPEEAYRRGWMPLASTGVPAFLKAHPTYDGRGVLIGILDSGIDPGMGGMSVTSAGAPKILDLRDFSGEGAIALERATPSGDSIRVAGRWLRGFGRVRALNSGGPWYIGTLRELPLGDPPASDLNWNDRIDSLPIIVTRASDGWVLFTDTDGDGSLLGEHPVHDYLVARESFGWAPRGHAPPLNIAANFSDSAGMPALDLFFDTGAHGSHVAGIAAGHDLYGVKGFDGVAPGAQLLGLKIANNATGGLSVTGSMLRALNYALQFASARRMPLVLNMSFGVGNEIEGTARIDQLIDSVLALHPGVLFAISAGNDGPGLSTVGFPGSAERALTVGASWPSAFESAPDTAPEPIAFFSSRGGELAKPDILAPGRAYSSVPRWNAGDERKGGTSMASPHAAGLAAILASALTQTGGTVEARRLKRALMVTARPRTGQTYIDEGTGLADVSAAYSWLVAGHDAPEVEARADNHGVTGAWRLHGLESPADTLQAFSLIRPSGASSEAFRLRSDAPWLSTPPSVTIGAGTTHLGLTYRAGALKSPGIYTGIVTGWGPDTLGGPAFRLINTVVVPAARGEDV